MKSLTENQVVTVTNVFLDACGLRIPQEKKLVAFDDVASAVEGLKTDILALHNTYARMDAYQINFVFQSIDKWFPMFKEKKK